MKQEVLVVGISGMLGGKIANAILDRGEHAVRALVRNAQGKRDALGALVERGVALVEGDVMEPGTLDAAMEGVSAVVSAVNNQEELIVEGQTNLLRAAERHGVARFIPSDFSADYRKLSMGDNFNFDMRMKFLPVLLESRVAHTLVLNGGFYEVLAAPFLGLVSLDRKEVTVWDDGEQPLEFTATSDVARYVAATVLDPRTANRALKVAGEVVSSNGLVRMLPGFSGRPAGSVAALKALIAEKQEGATNPWAYLGDQYLWSMVSGVATLGELDNDMYPEVKPQGILEFLGMA